MINKLEKYVTLKLVIILGAVFAVLYLIINVPILGYFRSCVDGNNYIESNMFYTPQSLHELLVAYGESGRSLYIKMSLGFDFIFPLVYSAFLAASIFLVYKNWRPLKKAWLKIGLIMGIVICFSDFLENIFLITIILKFPAKMEALSILALCATIIKSVLTVSAAALVIIGLIGLLIRKIQSRNNSAL